MESEQNGKEVLLHKLRAMQFAETSKPAERMDADLADVLTDLLLDLEGILPIRRAEIRAGLRAVLEKADPRFRQRNRKRSLRTILIAAILAALIAAAGLAYLTLGSQGNPDQFRWMHYIIEHILPGGSVDASPTVTIYLNGTAEKYDSVEAYLREAKYGVLYPTALPNGQSVTGVQVYPYANGDKTRISFLTENASETSVSVDLNSRIDDRIRSVYKEEVIGAYTCFVFSDENGWQGIFAFDGNVYTIDTKSYDDLYQIITNMKGSYES